VAQKNLAMKLAEKKTRPKQATGTGTPGTGPKPKPVKGESSAGKRSAKAFKAGRKLY